MSDFTNGDDIFFVPGYAGRAPYRLGKFIREVQTGVAEVRLSGDPFSVCVNINQVYKDTPENRRDAVANTDTEPTPKELRRTARNLGVVGWEDMTAKELKAAIETAEKSGGKKKSKAKAEDEPAKPAKAKKDKKGAKAEKPAKKSGKKAAAPEPEDDEDEGASENGNPYKEGTNLYFIAEEIFKGGKRTDMVRRLKKKIELRPRERAGSEFDVDAELDRRILIVGQDLKNKHGFTIVLEGRGAEGTIRVAQ